MELRIKLKSYTNTYKTRYQLDQAISKLGIYSTGSIGNGGYSGGRVSTTRLNDSPVKFYSIQKHRAKKIRNKKGKYIIKSSSYWKLTITSIPRELFTHLGKHVVQYNKTWKIEEKKS